MGNGSHTPKHLKVQSQIIQINGNTLSWTTEVATREPSLIHYIGLSPRVAQSTLCQRSQNSYRKHSSFSRKAHLLPVHHCKSLASSSQPGADILRFTSSPLTFLFSALKDVSPFPSGTQVNKTQHREENSVQFLFSKDYHHTHCGNKTVHLCKLPKKGL